ncbi:hypothetical protein AB0B66_36575 [Catellatospora sp. NPDC049111]|uniref:hypothetical protein n=1 Tax=Catellatospora sp. NPDC049111 TaxID=3155271 RepID=UPI00340254CE
MITSLSPTGFLARLKAIDRSGFAFGARLPSRRLLMREHMRRAALWSQAYSSEDWPFPALAEMVDSTVRAHPELVRRVRWVGASTGPGMLACEDALHWYTLHVVRGAELPDLPDPYEPLLMAFERGHAFTLISGAVEIDLSTIPWGTVAGHAAADPIVDLDPAILDEIDREAVV